MSVVMLPNKMARTTLSLLYHHSEFECEIRSIAFLLNFITVELKIIAWFLPSGKRDYVLCEPRMKFGTFCCSLETEEWIFVAIEDCFAEPNGKDTLSSRLRSVIYTARDSSAVLFVHKPVAGTSRTGATGRALLPLRNELHCGSRMFIFTIHSLSLREILW